MSSQADTQAAPAGDRFKNRKVAFKWLVDNGYSVSIGKFYQDIEQKGFPMLAADKSLSAYQVAMYGKSLATEQQPDPSALDRLEFIHRKEKAEAEISEMKSERMRRDEDALWLHADDAWSALAALIGELREVIRRELHAEQYTMINLAGGDITRAPELFEFADQVVSRAFNQVATTGMDVQWEGEQ